MALEIFLVRLIIWCFQLSEESIITPKYLMDSLIAFLLIFMVTLRLDGLLKGRNVINLVLSMLSAKRLTFSHR